MDTLPLDVIFEILGRVSPGDLVNISRMNRDFYATIMAPNAKHVWVSSRRTLNAPEPPDDITEPRWAQLLFHNTCQVCGSSGDTIGVNWMLRRRACENCRKRHVVKMNHAWGKRHLPDGEVAKILKYILCSDVGGWITLSDKGCSAASAGSKCYWRNDTYPPLLKLRDLNDAVSNGLPGAEDDLRAWKEERTKWVEKCGRLSKEHEVWYASLDDQYKSRTGAIRAQRLAAVKRRFIELGYSGVDIDATFGVETEGIKLGSANVTDIAWYRLRPRLEPMLIARKEWRLGNEALNIVNPRIEIFQQLYDQFRSHLRPYDKRQLPAHTFLRSLPELSEHIDAEKDVAVTRRSFGSFVDRLPEHIADYWSKYRETIVSQLPAAEFDEGSDPVEMARFVFICDASHALTSEQEGKLQTTVVCCDSGLLQGWAMISKHSNQCEGRHYYAKGVVPELARVHTIKPHRYYSKLATSLITLVGLDPASATIVDMDQHEAFFVCEKCSSRRRHKIYTWRQALNHSFSQSHPLCGFLLATDEGSTMARTYQDWVEPQLLIWHCNQCSSFSVAGRINITTHLHDQHGISNPGSDDFFIDEESRDNIPVYVYDSPLRGEDLFLCLHCPAEPLFLQRRFLRKGTFEHLRTKHSIRASQRDVDYRLANSAATSPPAAVQSSVSVDGGMIRF